MNVTLLETWFDVDTPDDLSRLQTLIEDGTITAPHTAEAISRCLSPRS
jgi:NDP-sugar pyrophosphorylase family protein